VRFDVPTAAGAVRWKSSFARDAFCRSEMVFVAARLLFKELDGDVGFTAPPKIVDARAHVAHYWFLKR